jgi:hypothetical protein
MSFSSMAITCSIGILFGVTVSSVPVAAILSVYLGSQLSSLIILPVFFLQGLNPVVLSLALGIPISIIVIGIDISLFNRQQF